MVSDYVFKHSWADSGNLTRIALGAVGHNDGIED